MGAATVLPLPPFSTINAKEIFGASAGANATNNEWSFSFLEFYPHHSLYHAN